MQAVIMAGGKGSRLYPYSALFPKPLMPIGDKPILEILLRQLSAAGITTTIIAVNHLRHLIEAFFGDGSRFGVAITYSLEDVPLGTAGPLSLILDQLDENFVVTNGDLLTTLNIESMIAEHVATGASATIGTYRRTIRSEFGVLEIDSEMRLVGYREKPTYEHLVSMGIYVLNRDAVKRWLKPGAYMDMPVLMQSMYSAGLLVRCHQQDCSWLDIGRPEDFAEAQSIVERDPNAFVAKVQS